MTHRFKVGEPAIHINPIYPENQHLHNTPCVITEPYSYRVSCNTTVSPPEELPPEWLYGVHNLVTDGDYLVDQSQLKPLVKLAPDKLKNRQWKRRHQRKPELIEV